MKEELLELLTKIIDKEKNTESTLISLNEILEKINKVIEHPNVLANFDLTTLIDNDIVSVEELNASPLYRYKKYAKNRFLQLTSNNQNEIKEYFINYKNLTIEKIKQIEFKITSKIEPIIKLKTKIENEENLDKAEFLECCNLLKENISNLDDYILVIKKLSLFVSICYEKNFQTENNVTKITNLERSDLEKLFQRFNLDFNNLNPEEQQRLITYGELNNIRSIFEVLKENGVIINITQGISKRVVDILIASNSDNVLYILNNIKKDYGNKETFNINNILNNYIKTMHTIFIGNDKKLERKESKDPKKTHPPKSEDSIPGAFANYKINREFLIEQGANIEDVVAKCPDILSSTPNTIKRSFIALLSYGIKKTSIFNTLSALNSKTPLDIIDQYIEAGFLEYIINNLTRARENLNPKVLYKMINAKISGHPEIIFRNQNLKTGPKLYVNEKTELSIFPGDQLLGDPEYHNLDLESMYSDIDFETLEEIDESVYNNHFIKFLEENLKQDDYTYKFNEIIISRYKVLRYFAILLNKGHNNLTALKYAILKNTIITKREYDMVIECLNQIFKEKTSEGHSQVNSENSLNSMLQTKDEFSQNVYQNFFIKLLDTNFLSKDDQMNYNFNGVIVSREHVISNFAKHLIEKTVMPHPLEALRKAILATIRRDYNRSPETQEYYTINLCLNNASEGIKDMGRRL